MFVDPLAVTEGGSAAGFNVNMYVERRELSLATSMRHSMGGVGTVALFAIKEDLRRPQAFAREVLHNAHRHLDLDKTEVRLAVCNRMPSHFLKTFENARKAGSCGEHDGGIEECQILSRPLRLIGSIFKISCLKYLTFLIS